MEFKGFGLQTGCGFILKHTLIENLERKGLERLVATKKLVRVDVILFSEHSHWVWDSLLSHIK